MEYIPWNNFLVSACRFMLRSGNNVQKFGFGCLKASYHFDGGWVVDAVVVWRYADNWSVFAVQVNVLTLKMPDADAIEIPKLGEACP
jgi:hypothetical protein